MTQPPGPAPYFVLFNEIGIIEQLSRTFLESRLPDGLIAPHFAVLNHLIRVADGRTPLELARAFQVPKTTMTHTLSGLSKHELVEMRPNPDDARSKQVWLTDKGRILRDQTIAALAPDFGRVADAFPPEKVAAILPILQELRIFLDKDRETSRFP
ncbi:MAG: MarR family winged helix-turn-helix transcriptional regulator [Pseudomonadota bacterium]